MEQAEEHCYVCLQGSTEETPFMDPNPCYCRGSTKLHQHCFNQMRETVYKCGMCNKDWRDGKYTRIWDNQYCDNGNKWQETHYSDGKLHGTHTSWDFEGVKVLESNYDN